MHYLVFVPAFEVICVLGRNLLVVGSYVPHDLSQVLTFGCVNVHLHTRPGDLVPQLHDVLYDEREEREVNMPDDVKLLFPDASRASRLTFSWFFFR